MAIEINLPDIGSDEVEVIEIFVKVGDKVSIEQTLISIEGDKASIEIPTPFAGTIKELKVNIGDKITTGYPIILLEKEEKTAISDVTIYDTDSNKSTKEFNNFTTSKNIPIKTEQLLNTQEANTAIKTKNKLINYDYEFIANDNDHYAYVYATPLIRRFARKFGINLGKIKGTGRKGRILQEDCQSYIKEAIKHFELFYDAEETSLSYKTSILPLPKINFSYFGECSEIELSRIQKISGANLSRNWTIIPHVTIFDKIDITDLEFFRKKQNSEADKLKLNIKITILVFVIKAVATALKQMPRFNSSLSEDSNKLILKQYINIGVAVDTKNGLVVPVIKNVNNKGIIEISSELMTISKKARDGKLTTAEMQGGCFTISSIGNIGTTHFSPIVNAPEVGILGISKSSIEAIWNGKEFTPRLMLPISLSFDHRVIDGADGARFITIINKNLSDIRCLLI